MCRGGVAIGGGLANSDGTRERARGSGHAAVTLWDSELGGRKVICFFRFNFRQRSHRVIGSIAPSHAKVSCRQESAVGVHG